MNRRLLAAAAVALLGIASPSWASPVTIDFDALPSGSFTSGSEDGFTLTATRAILQPLSFVVPGFSNLNYIASDGNGNGNWLLTLVESDASNFEFLGLSGSSIQTTAFGGNLTVRGFQGATLVGTDIFAVFGGNGTSFSASNLNGLALTRVEIEGQYEYSQGLSAFADNIRLETEVAAVPEPGTLALAGLAIAASA